MIICICRNIKESDYQTNEDLLNRLNEDDIQCGKCIDQTDSYSKQMDHQNVNLS